MKHASQTEFGRAKRAALDVMDHGPDKWLLLRHLTESSEVFGLSHRTLSVLKALLTFLPTRHIPQGTAAIVFPANKTLSHRLSGMPESTLRRHLAMLVKVGIVSRHDSPNRKRFARHRAGSIALAYGFDLAPLANMADQLETHAGEAREAQEALIILRTQVLDLRAMVLDANGPSDLTTEAALILRRKPDQTALLDLRKRLETAIEHNPLTERSADKVSVTIAQNERHIQSVSKYTNTSKRPNSVSLTHVLRKCSALRDFWSEEIKNWQGLFKVSQQIAPMMGLTWDILRRAERMMGRSQSAIVVLCMLQRFSMIDDPNKYLNTLIASADNGSLNIKTLLSGSDPSIVI